MVEVGKILENVCVAKDMYLMYIHTPQIVKTAKAGQFVNVLIDSSTDPLLRRPISLHDIERETGCIYLLYQVVGKGTELMAKMQAGDSVDLIGPLGNSFNLDYEGKKSLLVGGGIGVAPLYPIYVDLLAKGKEGKMLLGARGMEYLPGLPFYDEHNVPYSIITDDGSSGRQGFVTELLCDELKTGEYSYVYACGPTPMLKAVEKVCQEYNVAGQISMEAHMGCGLGLCLSCTCSEKNKETYAKVCKDGPIFDMGVIDHD